MKKFKLILIIVSVFFVAIFCEQINSAEGSRFTQIKHEFNYTPIPINDMELVNLGGWSKSKSIMNLPYIYNIETQKVQNINNKMIYKRDVYYANKLNQDEILILGSCFKNNLCPAEIYRISTQTFEEIGMPHFVHFYPQVIEMNDGNFFIISGSQAEIYNPVTRKFNLAGSLKETKTYLGQIRKYTTLYNYANSKAVKLNNGQILITGSKSSFELRHQKKEDKNAEIYDPIKNIFMPTGQLSYTRMNHTMNLLPDGTVLIAGGNSRGGCNLVEIYDPQIQKFYTIKKMKCARYNHSAITLNNGNVLIVGGIYGHDYWMKPIRNAEVYNYKTKKFEKVGLTVERPAGAKLELLGKNKVIIAGNGIVEIYSYK